MHLAALLLPCLTFVTLWMQISAVPNPSRGGGLAEVFSWKALDFQFPNDRARKAAIDSGDFIPGNSVPMGVEVWKDKVFISVPRLASGVPASLNYVKLDARNKSPKLIPYPNWEAQSLKDDNKGLKIVSPFRMNVDECDRLWMVDLGITDIKTSFTKLFQPRILAFDLNTNRLVLEREIEASLLPSRTWIANIIIDADKSDCSNSYAYIPDLWGKVLIVYSLAQDKAFQINHQYFNSDPLAGNYFIGGFNFRWDDGIFGVALSPYDKRTRDRTLFFHSLSAYTEFAVSTKSIQNETASTDFYAYKLVGSRGPFGQSGAQSMDEKTGVLFFTLPHKNAVGCWNSMKYPNEYSPKTAITVFQNNVTMLYPSDLKVDKLGNVWVISNRLPVFNHDALDQNDVNFRIFTGQASKIVENTACDLDYTRPPIFENQGGGGGYGHHHHNRNNKQRRAPAATSFATYFSRPLQPLVRPLI